jgi:E3 ubiquitin-protein ligase BRE1
LESETETGRVLEKINEELRAEITKIRSVMDALHLKHKEMSAEIGTARDLQVKDQSEIKRLAGMHMLMLVRQLIDVRM